MIASAHRLLLLAADLQLNTPSVRHRRVDSDRVRVCRRQRHRIEVKAGRGTRGPCLQNSTRCVEIDRHAIELVIGRLDRDLLVCRTAKRIATTLTGSADHDRPWRGIDLERV